MPNAGVARLGLLSETFKTAALVLVTCPLYVTTRQKDVIITPEDVIHEILVLVYPIS